MSQRPVRRRPTVGPPRPAIRLRPAPALEPPFDDELPPLPQNCSAPGTEQLALDLRAASAASRPSGAANTPAGQPRVSPAANRPPAQPTGPSAESCQAARRFVCICLEILNGYRPTGQIRPFTSPAQAAGVVEQLGVARERVAVWARRGARTDRRGPRTPRPAPPRGQPRQRDPVRLRRLRVCEPRPGVAEAAVVLHANGHTWALAIRLERPHDRWLCTAARTV